MSRPAPASIDLHNLRPEAALARLEQGLHTARASGSTEALVICGRGASNRTGTPILRTKVEAWLRSPAGERSGVASFTRAAKGGALWVQFGNSK